MKTTRLIAAIALAFAATTATAERLDVKAIGSNHEFGRDVFGGDPESA